MLMGGRKYEISPEDHIFAAVQIFLDIVYIFWMLLSLFGSSKVKPTCHMLLWNQGQACDDNVSMGGRRGGVKRVAYGVAAVREELEYGRLTNSLLGLISSRTHWSAFLYS
ncbi:hypothetical protein Y032_0188g1160 [Ancylostoma ceylanicum]|nr:hypothetical protein Y032_0188g1160 [Ancylostoma ceylanicum]